MFRHCLPLDWLKLQHFRVLQQLFDMSSPTPTSPIMSSRFHQAKQPDKDDGPSKDQTSRSSRSDYYGPRKSLGFAAFLPFAIVVLWSFGLGSSLLIWLLVKRVPPSGASSAIFDGYLVADEGNKTGRIQGLDGQGSVESTMRGVLIMSAISNISSLIVVPLMALGAFHVAAKWLDDQVLSKDGPTPLQFGLVMQMCSSGNLKSVFMTLLYLFKRWISNPPSPRSRVSPLVYRALLVAGAVTVLHYGVIIANLLLTAELGSAYYPKTKELDVNSSSVLSNLGTQYNPDNSYWDWLTKYLDGPDTSDPVNPWDPFMQEALETITGNSTKNHIGIINLSTSSFLQDAEHMAVILRPPSSVPSQLSWTAPTIGMKTQCRPLPCVEPLTPDAVDNDSTFVYCPTEKSTIPYHSIPPPSFDYMAFLNDSVQRENSQIIPYTSIGQELLPIVDLDWPQPPRLSNPSHFFMKLLLQNDNAWSERRDATELGQIMLFGGGMRWRSFVFYLGACEVTMYHVEISFNASRDGARTINGNGNNYDTNSQYSLASTPVPMTPEETNQIFLPTFLGVQNGSNPSQEGRVLILPGLDYIAIPTVAAVLFRDIIGEGFSTKVSSEFARQALALVSGMDVTTVPASKAAEVSARLVSRYPLAETMVFIGMVYAHGLLAIILFTGIVRKSSKTIKEDGTYRSRNWYGLEVGRDQAPIRELELVQLRLTDPLAIVAEHFLQPGQQKEGQDMSGFNQSTRALLTRRDAVGMFDEENPNTIRVDIGLIDHSEGGRWYGLKNRRDNMVISDPGKDV